MYQIRLRNTDHYPYLAAAVRIPRQMNGGESALCQLAQRAVPHPFHSQGGPQQHAAHAEQAGEQAGTPVGQQ